MKKNLAVFSSVCLGALLLLNACSKSSKMDPENNIENPTTASSIDNYLPSTPGTWWLYNSSTGEQFKREATGIDTVVAGLTMKFFTNTKLATLDTDPEFFNRFDDNKYFTLFTFDSTAETANYIPLVVMKDNPYVGMEWLNEGFIDVDGYGTVEMNAICSIESLTDVVVLDDTTFNNAVRMKANLKAKAPGLSWIDCGSITYWFVKTVGIVQQDFNIELKVLGVSLYKKNHLDVLKEFHIEP